MTDRRLSASSRLGARLAFRAGTPALYRRGNGVPVELVVVLTNPLATGQPPTHGTAGGTDANESDAIIAAADLATLGEPQVNDELDITIGDTVHRYGVVRGADDTTHRYTDPGRTLIRLHLQYRKPL